jgi:hypothetical protein
MKRFFLALAALYMSNSCLAAGWTSEMSIVSINTEAGSDLVYFMVSPATTYAAGCDSSNWIVSSATEARAQRFYSTLMSAMLSGKKVKFWYTDTCGSFGYHTATAVKIVN